MDHAESHPILVLSANWQTRALLAAQIGETTGREVVSAPAVNEALALIRLAGIEPALVIVDTGQQVAREEVERLMDAVPGAPFVLGVGTLRRTEFDPLVSRCAAYLVRPVSVGQIAQAAVHILQGK